MKKLLTLILIVVITLSVAACDSKNENTDTSSTDTSSVSSVTTVQTYQKIETVTVEEAVAIFKADPYAEVEGYTLDDYGWLNEYREGFIGNIHTFGLENKNDIEYLETSRNYAFGLNENKLSKYSFGEVVSTTPVAKGSIYCGISENSGFVFRKDDCVFCINFDLSETKTVATGVRLVIDTDYAYNSDNPSQILLLMKDGSIKAYLEWKEQLLDPCYEGSYGGTLIQ